MRGRKSVNGCCAVFKLHHSYRVSSTSLPVMGWTAEIRLAYPKATLLNTCHGPQDLSLPRRRILPCCRNGAAAIRRSPLWALRILSSEISPSRPYQQPVWRTDYEAWPGAEGNHELHARLINCVRDGICFFTGGSQHLFCEDMLPCFGRSGKHRDAEWWPC